jgi:hypothetical protein
MEYALFCRADASGWQGGTGQYWGVHGNGTVEIGDRGEIIAKFPANANPQNPWHGYPVEVEDGRENDCPPEELVLAWIEANTVSSYDSVITLLWIYC